ncbi:MAG TPA: MarR family transcriptional regulator [Candidatus Acidoferrales bacterium]|nr:MarR family transcriptional regulator [Candidatus Acidoferrales bacterium]
MDQHIYQLRLYLSVIQAVTNKAFRIAPGIKSDLSAAESFIVYRCNFFNVNMKDIAKANNVVKSTVSYHIDMLEKKGYVQRVRGEKDKRDVFVIPTQRAKMWIAETEQKVLDYVEGGLSNLTPDEQLQFVTLFSKFVGEMESMPYEKIMRLVREEKENEI